jgi:hypothetical protein
MFVVLDLHTYVVKLNRLAKVRLRVLHQLIVDVLSDFMHLGYSYIPMHCINIRGFKVPLTISMF